MVAYLSKSDASEGFNQIIDFLNGSSIKYALTCMSAKRTSWNEFSSSIASTVICLSSGKGFSRVETPLFEGMLVEQQVDEEGMQMRMLKMLMLVMLLMEMIVLHMEKFLLLMKNHPYHLLHHLLHHHNHLKISLQHLRYNKHHHNYLSCSGSRNYKVEKEGKETREDEQGKSVEAQKVTEEDDKEEDREVVDAVKDVEEAMEDETEPAEVQEVVKVMTTAKLIYEVTTASDPITAASTTIPAAAAQVLDVTVIAAPARVVAAPSRRRKGIVIKDPESESTTSIIIPVETKSNDKGKRILVEEPKPFKKKQQIKQDEQYARELHTELNKDIDWDEVINHTKSQARKNMILYLKNVGGFKMDYFKGMSYDDIRPIFEAKFNSNVAFLQKTREEIEEEESRPLKRINETPAKRAAKRRKLYKEVEKLKRYL
nr:hypothetical protein [Tanacetum cinerariifolium]